MMQDDKGERVGVWKGPKKDDVIYEQPLMPAVFLKPKFRLPQIFLILIFFIKKIFWPKKFVC